MKGFFAKSTLRQSKAPIPTIPQCGACGLYKACNSPKMAVDGEGRRKILLIGEAPGITEDRKGKPFIGETGQLLKSTLRRFGIDMRKDCWITNSIICFPPDGHGKWRKPKRKEVEFCRPNIIRAIKELKPEIIVPLGDSAVDSLIGWLWKENPGPIGRWVGWKIPHQKLNAWICPTWHPSFIVRQAQDYGTGRKNEVAERFWEHHLKQMSRLEGRPWNKIPDFRSQVEIIMNPEQAARIIREFIQEGGTAAFDFETNMLKPDWPDARIISCSICMNGRRTIAYPWVGAAIPATLEFVKSPIRKIASNLKFEERWSLKILKARVRNWWWDTMLAAHIHDHRRAITGLKFQMFVWFGQESYDDHIHNLLRSKGDERTNQALREIDLKDLLLYNGLDSLGEYKLAFKQRKVMGYSND